MYLALKAVGLCTISIFASRNKLMKAVDGCTVMRQASVTDIVQFNTRRLGYCRATGDVCKDLNAISSNSNGRDCDCQCLTGYATFLVGENVCFKNEDVHYGCKIYEKNLKKSDPLPVIGLHKDLELSLTMKEADNCLLNESLTKYRNASSWASFPLGSFPLNVVSRKVRKLRSRQRGRKKKNNRKAKRKKKDKYTYSVKLLSAPEYLWGRLVQLVFSCGSKEECFMFKVEGKLQYVTNICASLVPSQLSTVVMDTFSYSTIRVTSTADNSTSTSQQAVRISTNIASTALKALRTSTFSYSTFRVTSTADISTSTTQQAVRISTNIAPTALKALRTSSVVVATKTLLPSTMTTRTSMLATKTHSLENKTLYSTEMRESMLTIAKQTPGLSTTTNGLFSTEMLSPVEPLTTYSSLFVKTEDFKVVVEKRQKVDKNNIWPIVGGVIGAVLLVSIASIALICFIGKRSFTYRQKGKQDGSTNREYQMQSAGSVNDAYSRGTESLYSVIEDKNITYQALSHQTNDEHNYQQLCNPSKSRLQHSDNIYSYPDNSTLERKESDEIRKAHGTTDADYCKVKSNYFPPKNKNNVSTPINDYDYAAMEGKAISNMKIVEDQIKRREVKSTNEKDSPYYKVLESPDISSEMSASFPPNSSVTSNASNGESAEPDNMKKVQPKYHFHSRSPKYASLSKESEGSGYAELVRDTDSEHYLLPREEKHLTKN